MNLIVIIVISLTVLFILVGVWLSLPADVPFAPSQRFIDSLPTWLQGPRRIAPTVKDESFDLAHYISQVQPAPADAYSADTQYHLATPVMPPAADEGHESHIEAEPVEAVHDEP